MAHARKTPDLLTLDAAVRAVAALRRLHAVCLAMDAERHGDRPSEDEYQAAMGEAEAALRLCPGARQLPIDEIEHLRKQVSDAKDLADRRLEECELMRREFLAADLQRQRLRDALNTCGGALHRIDCNSIADDEERERALNAKQVGLAAATDALGMRPYARGEDAPNG